MLASEVLDRARREAGRLRGKWRIERRGNEHVVQKWMIELDVWRDVLHCARVELAEDYLLKKISRNEEGGGLDCRFRIT